MFRTLTFCAVLAGLAAGGCYAEAGGYVTSDPYLVYTEPGVYVVANASTPIYYEDGTYWYYDNGVWVWSDVSTGNWRHGRRPPPALVAIHDPDGYAVHARAHGHRVRVDAVGHGEMGEHGRRRRPGEMHRATPATPHPGMGEHAVPARPGEMHRPARPQPGMGEHAVPARPGEMHRATPARPHPGMGEHAVPARPGTRQRPEQHNRKLGEHEERGPMGTASPRRDMHGHGKAKGHEKSKRRDKDRDHDHDD